MSDKKNILITGGTGSFARAFSRYLLAHNLTNRLCIFSRNEHAQAWMRAEFDDDPRLRWFIGDVRDEDRLFRAMKDVEVVVHAAALKRIEVGHYNPDEMVKTNVLGAMNVISAARISGVGKVVALSTDKAFQPISAYGHSKGLMESLMLAANANRTPNEPIFAVTRYGNVWGSAGSVVPRWIEMRQRNRNASLPLTNALCTRFFMTIQEAVTLVMGTIGHMKGGEIAVPTLPAYRLGDLAAVFGGDFVEAGLPQWEKLHESMQEGLSSDKAPRMSIEALREHVDNFMT